MRRGIRRLVRASVIAHTKDDQSIRGVLKAEYRDCIVLAEPHYLHEAKEDSLKGDAVIPRDNLSWLQVRDAGT